MFGLGGDPFQGQQAPWSAGPGPLGDLQYQVASVLNAADQNHVYVPTGPGNPIITFPRPQAGYRAATPVGPVAPSTGSGGRPVVGFLVLLVAVLTVAVVVLAVSGR